jgi:hypothetical protein
MKKILGGVLLFAALVFLAYAAVPDLLRDTAHRGHWRPTNEWVAEKPKCTRYTFVVSNCSVTAVRRFAPGDRRRLSYFTFADWGGRTVVFVQSAKDSGVISLRPAAEGLVGRWAFLIVVVAGIAAILLAGVSALRMRRTGPAFG